MTSPNKPLTLAVLGCGTLGTAILCGVLDALSTSTSIPSLAPTCFSALVTRKDSASRIQASITSLSLSTSVTIHTDSNVNGVANADMVLLGCKPYMVAHILSARGMSTALEGKLLISICAGVKTSDLQSLVPSTTRVVRVMPNTAAKLRESMTVISPSPQVTQSERDMVVWVFEQIGRTLVLDEKHMDTATALCGSGPAFFARESVMMAAQTMLGTAKMVLDGQHPAIIREQVSTPAGCTIAGLLTMEDGKVRSVIARTIQEATNVAGGLGRKK
ncbi:hypothetical protein BDD12DRAFT_834425 [Trichophaea hybrida]|nr:hypothetical protein BDD12DRAFT_834425 [Trichophaea hybrida]